MRIVDAQVHIWSSGTPVSPHRPVSSYSAAELVAEMREAGVHGAIIHPPGWDPLSNTLAMAAVQDYPGMFGILGNFQLEDPRNRLLVKEWNTLPGMLGLRFALFHPEQQEWVRDGTLDWLWPAAASAGVPVATMAGGFLPEFRAIAERHPELTLIIDHLGLVRRATDAAAFVNIDQVVALASLPNVHIKATGVPACSSHPYPFRNIHDELHRIYDAFGPKRFFWGTDITRMPCSYRQCVSLFTEELRWLAGTELELVMGRAICELLGRALPADEQGRTTTG